MQGSSFIYIDNVNGESVRTIWVLGSVNTNADKSIEWGDKLPNFTDPDVVIVNLQSLDKDIIQRIDKDQYRLARDLMWDGFIHGNLLIFITTSHNEILDHYIADEPQYVELIKQKNGNQRYSRVDYPIDYLCPLKLETVQVPHGTIIEYVGDHPYREYLKTINKYTFFINRISYASLSNFQRVTLTESEYPYAIETYKITDKSQHSLGGIYDLPKLNCKGTLVLLPPPTSVSIEEGIDRILEALGRPIVRKPAFMDIKGFLSSISNTLKRNWQVARAARKTKNENQLM
jgi:hypothetical protein